MNLSAAEFLDHLKRSGLASAKTLGRLRGDDSLAHEDGEAVAARLVQEGIITAFQAQHLLAGRSSGFFIGKYKILEPIGKGGMGKVFRAEDTRLRREIALKVLPLWAADDRRALARFQREARTAARLMHENIVQVYDVGRHRQAQYLAMELVEGADLEKRIRQKGRLPVAEAVAIIEQVADGLQHAFQQGVTHRDIKPSNILVKPDGKAKILDMGIARFRGGDSAGADSLVTHTGEVMGTVDYMAPEQANDTRDADVRSDLYALGCTLYHCLVGHVPFPDGTLANKLTHHQCTRPPAPHENNTDVSRSLSEIVQRMMAKSPDDRPQTPAEVADQLRSLQLDSETTGRIVAADWKLAEQGDIDPSGGQIAPDRPFRYGPDDVLGDRYEIISLIGKGGMGEVYRARDRQLSREIAIKTLPEYKALDPTTQRRFEREAKSLAALSHPNVLAIHDIGRDQGIPFVVFELVEGETLRSVLASGRLDWPRIVGIARGIVAGLAAAHERGIVHRDIKPENVLVLPDARTKVVDFGLARLQPNDPLAQPSIDSSVTSPGAMIGTVPYMSPEQASGTPLSSASDMFSLGVVLYELATGQHPFRAASVFGTLDAIVHQQPPLACRLEPEIPAPLEAVIMQMLEKNQQQRLTADQALAHLLQIDTRADAAEPSRAATSSNRDQTVCVGRDKELGQLNAALQSARQGKGRLLCVAGDAGIGKTTLVERFLQRTQSLAEPCIIARGSCSERLAGSDGYLPFLEALGEMLTGNQRQRAAETMRLAAPSWYVQVLTTQTGATGDGQLADVRGASQERMKRELVSYFQSLGRTAPVVFFLDDLHWVDLSTADLLTYLAGKSTAARLLLVCSYRPTELARGKNAFVQAKLDLQARGVCEELTLGMLAQDDVERYLNLRFPRQDFPPELAETIHARTEGNALFLVDLVRYLRESGTLAQEDETWVLARPLSEIEQHIPDSVRSMVQKKTEQLGEEQRRLLVAASVQGAEFHAAVIAKALEVDECDVEDQLELLSRIHGLVRRVGEEELPDATLTLRYRFVHALYQNAFYGLLTPARRAKLSAKVASALARFFETDFAEIVLEVAILLEAARDFAAACDCFLQAARNAAKRSANHEAIALARRVIDNARRLALEPRQRRTLDAALHLARLYQTIGRFDDAVGAFELAERTASESGDCSARIEAICGQASTSFLNKQMDTTRQLGTQALQLARDNQLEVGQAQAESVLAVERLCYGDFEQAERLYERSIPVLKRHGRVTHAMDAAVFRMMIYAWRLEFDRFDADRQWWTAQARKLDVSPIPMYFFGGMALGNQGRLSEALLTAREGSRLAELNNDGYHICRLPNVVGWLCRELGDWDQAISLDQQSQRLGRELGFEEAEANARVNLAHDFITLNELDNAHEQLGMAEQLFERDVWFRWRYNIRLHAEWARYYLARDDLLQAERYARASIDLATNSQARKHTAWGHKLLADVLRKQDSLAQARHELNQALQILDRYPCPTVDWRISVTAAKVARATKDVELEATCRARVQNRIEALSDSLDDEKLRNQFLRSESVRKAIAME